MSKNKPHKRLFSNIALSKGEFSTHRRIPFREVKGERRKKPFGGRL